MPNSIDAAPVLPPNKNRITRIATTEVDRQIGIIRIDFFADERIAFALELDLKELGEHIDHLTRVYQRLITSGPDE